MRNLEIIKKFYAENKGICDNSFLKFPLIVKTE